MRIRIAVPEEHVNPDVINSGLETLTRLNTQLIASGKVPLFDDALRAGRVRWQEEGNPGEEHFDHAGIVMARGHGDCDDLGPWKAASLRVTGEDPYATSTITRTGPRTWHAIVNRSGGGIEDPSRAAGMGGGHSVGGNGTPAGAYAPVCAPMFSNVGLASLAAQPWGGLWIGRADLPWATAPQFAFSATAADTSLIGALHAAIVGACCVGHQAGCAARDDLARFFVADAIAQGVDPRRVVSGMYDAGMYLDADSWNHAARVGAMLQGRTRRFAARL